jgi:hypothetical protein
MRLTSSLNCNSRTFCDAEIEEFEVSIFAKGHMLIKCFRVSR